ALFTPRTTLRDPAIPTGEPGAPASRTWDDIDWRKFLLIQVFGPEDEKASLLTASLARRLLSPSRTDGNTALEPKTSRRGDSHVDADQLASHRAGFPPGQPRPSRQQGPPAGPPAGQRRPPELPGRPAAGPRRRGGLMAGTLLTP